MDASQAIPIKNWKPWAASRKELKTVVADAIKRRQVGLSGKASHAAPSMKHVAELAGVSVMTVSRALANKDNISEKTKRRVEAAAKSLGYRNECVQCGNREWIIFVRFGDEPRKLFCGKACLVKFYSA